MRDPKLVDYQRQIESLFDKNQAIPCIIEEFRGLGGGKLCDLMDAFGIDQDFGFHLLAQMALHRRCQAPVLFGVMRRFYPDLEQVRLEIEKCINANLVQWDDNGQGTFITQLVVSDELQTRLDRFQYMLPMIVEPLHLLTTRDTGYFTLHGSLILNQGRDEEEDICLDHLNRMNAIPLAINHRTVAGAVNTWKHIDAPQPGETQAEFKKRQRAFQKFDRVSRWVISCLSKLTDRIYITHRYDFRGRTYTQGYHVNPQGAPWNKAMIEFADKEFI